MKRHSTGFHVEHLGPADQVERRPLAMLVPYARNARTHSDEQVVQIAASMREWGFTVPVLVDESNMIIAGHGRVLAAARLGLAEIPVTVARGWSEAQKRAYVIADNKLTENGGWDRELLQLEAADLSSLGFELPLLGFAEPELRALLGVTGKTDPDAVPELPAEPITERGDVWQLGRHRLVCGDATDRTDVTSALAGVAPNLMVTDPPYGIAYDPAWRTETAKKSPERAARWGITRAHGKVKNDARADWREAWELFPGNIAYVWHSALFANIVAAGLVECGFQIRSQIIWAKNVFVISRGDYHWQHEPCWYAVRNRGDWTGDRKQSTLWSIGNNAHSNPDKEQGHGHGTQKPVECMKRPIENNSSGGQAIYDPFVGTGSTIIAAEMTGRVCHAIDIDPAYVDVAVQRWEEFTGDKAKRLTRESEENGKTRDPNAFETIAGKSRQAKTARGRNGATDRE